MNAPWGIAVAPANFGTYSNNLLVGNFGDGVINAFDATTGAFVGALADSNGTAFANPGLWGIGFGNGAQNQPTTTLYFAAGIANEADGLYGRIDLGATAPELRQSLDAAMKDIFAETERGQTPEMGSGPNTGV